MIRDKSDFLEFVVRHFRLKFTKPIYFRISCRFLKNAIDAKNTFWRVFLMCKNFIDLVKSYLVGCTNMKGILRGVFPLIHEKCERAV